MHVVVLGAGASFGREGGIDLPPPLTWDFFKRAVRLGLFEDGIFENWAQEFYADHGIDIEELAGRLPHLDMGDNPGHLAGLKQFVADQMDVTPDQYDRADLDVERLMGLIEGQLLGYHGLLRRRGELPQGPRSADVLEGQLYLVICGTLVATTAGHCAFHRALAESLLPGDVVIGFNYDLLMDRALRERGDWVMNDGYGLSFHRIGRRRDDEVDWRVPLYTNSSVRLLKPHGSLNWLYPTDPNQTLMNVDLHGIEREKPPALLYCLEDLHTDFLEDHPVYEWREKYEHHTETRVWDMLSLIVPPAVTKPYRNMEPLVGGVWAEALEFLVGEAEEISFVGYSFRPEDLRSWWLFRTAASENEQLRRVRVVDPSDEVFARIGRVFDGWEVVRPARTLEEWAAGDFR